MSDFNEKYIKFGKILINRDKLYNKNILSIRNNKDKGIEGCNTCKVSGKFVNMINDYEDGCEITKEQYDNLEQREQILYDKLVMLGKLRRVVCNNIEQSVKIIDELYKNQQIDDKIYKEYVYTMYIFGCIQRKDIREALLHFSKNKM